MKSPGMKFMNQHIEETDLALYVSGDLGLFRRASVRFHAGRCERCRGLVEAYRADRGRVREIAAEMPAGVDWDRLSAEMTANIRVGLAAGECVARPRQRKPGMNLTVSWRPAAIAAGAVALLSVAWLLNMPSGTTDELGRAMGAILHGRGSIVNPSAGPGVRSGAEDDRRPVVVANQLGIELRENNNVMGASQDERPVSVSLSVQGSASARYVNADTGQISITSVYVQ
jgi:anti-sigma factor RsiW